MTTKLRQTLYLVGTIGSGIVGVALLWGGISADTAASLTQVITGLGALLGAGAAGTAGVTVTRQARDGVLDSNPLDQVLGGLAAITSARDQAAADFDAIAAAVGDQLGSVPVLGDLAQAVIATTRR